MREIFQGFTDVKGVTTNVVAWAICLGIAFLVVRTVKLIRARNADRAARAQKSREQVNRIVEGTILAASMVAFEPTAPTHLELFRLQANRYRDTANEGFRLAVACLAMILLCFLLPVPATLAFAFQFKCAALAVSTTLLIVTYRVAKSAESMMIRTEQAVADGIMKALKERAESRSALEKKTAEVILAGDQLADRAARAIEPKKELLAPQPDVGEVQSVKEQ